MTVTQAVEIIALDVRVWCRRNNVQPSLSLVEGRVSELAHDDSLKGEAARILAGNGQRQRRALAAATKEL